MSFVQRYRTELQRLAPLFEAAKQADIEFHQAWDEGCSQMGFIEYKKTDQYLQKLNAHHNATNCIDEVISTALLHAKLGDLEQLPTIFAYLALPLRYFRSGYQRANIWRYLKKLPLNEEQSDILREIILCQIEAAGPEFIEIRRFARRIDSVEWRERLNKLGLQSEKHFVQRRVKRLLAQ